MNTQTTITEKLQKALTPEFLEVLNESHMHSGPATESHFRLSVVSEQFTGLPAVQRHQMIYACLAAELQGGVHALAVHTYTPDEWLRSGNTIPESPDCRGGSKTPSS